MARNRKRRGDPRPSDVDPPRSGLRTAGGLRAGRDQRIGSRVDDPSDPIGHAAPDAELAEAQLAAGEARAEQPESEPVLGPEADIPGLGGPPAAPVAGPGGEVFGDEIADDEADDAEHRELVHRPARRRSGIVGFAQGSWRELQRVQWPDQRQVVQATGVVIGFVIVAGAYLGVADWVATKIVNLILS
jgi:preprotein translocase subunit SecE